MEVLTLTPPPEKQTPQILGGKGHGLVWMASHGLPVPPAVIIPTSECRRYQEMGKEAYRKEIEEALPGIKQQFIDAFGYMPLVSVRSGAPVSMPGMMDTILNVGLHLTTLEEYSERIGAQCALDSYGRLVEMFADVVMCVPRQTFEGLLPEYRTDAYKAATSSDFPEPDEQIIRAIMAVFDSWFNDRAIYYRKQNNIPASMGTAVVIQSMVFGNAGEDSCTGVLFTRHPDTGENMILGEFLPNAQGEDVVAGTVTPLPLSKMHGWNVSAYDTLVTMVSKLEELKKDAQDVEFTVQNGTVYLLQTRTAKRSAPAAIRMAVEMHEQGILSREEALSRVSPREFDLACLPTVDKTYQGATMGTGIPACSGAAIGEAVFSAARAVELAAKGKKVLLITEETTPDDIAGMDAAAGILTMKGGSTSHAAVVARSMNRPCVVGLGLNQKDFQEGKTYSIDGASGRVWEGAVPLMAGGGEHLKKFVALLTQGTLQITDGYSPLPAGATAGVLDLQGHLFKSAGEIAELIVSVHTPGLDSLVLTRTLSPEWESFYETYLALPRIGEYAAGKMEGALGILKEKHADIFACLKRSGPLAGHMDEDIPAIDCMPAKLDDLAKAKPGDVLNIKMSGASLGYKRLAELLMKYEGVKHSATTLNEPGTKYQSLTTLTGSMLKAS